MPKILIVRIYENWTIATTYSNNGSKKYRDKLYKKLELEAKSKHFDRYEIYINGDDIGKEEEFESSFIINDEEWEIYSIDYSLKENT
jgi:hypothetical protein